MNTETLKALEQAIEPYRSAGFFITSQSDGAITLAQPKAKFSYLLFIILLLFWPLLNKDSSQFDPNVTVMEQNGQMQITPLANATGNHYSGYVSTQTWDMTGLEVSVEAVQVTNGPGMFFVTGRVRQAQVVSDNAGHDRTLPLQISGQENSVRPKILARHNSHDRGIIFQKQSGKSQANRPEDDTEEEIADVG